MPDLPYEIQSEDGIPVRLPSGSTHYVLTGDEKHYLEDKIQRYLHDNHFINVSDMQDIDKMIVFEMLIHRWSLWVTKGRDYYDDAINVKQYADLSNQFSSEVRQIKKALGVDKSTRDKTRGDDSIAALWENLLRRGKEFDTMRSDQFAQVITSFQRMKALITFYDNTDEQERKENRCELKDVFEVLRQEIQKFDEIDENFKFTKQHTWIRNQ